MMLLLILTLLVQFSTNFVNPSQAIYLSPSHSPSQPFGTKSVLKHVSAGTELFSSFLTAQRHYKRFLSAAPTASPVSQGPITGCTGSKPRHHYHRHIARFNVISPSPTNPGCSRSCAEPLTSAPFGSPCMCVIPMRVRLLLRVPLHAIFPEITELEIEVAAGTYLKQNQVAINGATDTQNQEGVVVDIYLIPLGEKFDDRTATLIYKRFLHKKVHLSWTLFGDYDVMNISYPGHPASPPFGEGPTGSAGNQHHPINAEFVEKKQKTNPQIITAIVLSAFMLSFAAYAAVCALLKCRNARRPSKEADPIFMHFMNKSSGFGTMWLSSPTISTSSSPISTVLTPILSVKTFSLMELEIATENFSPSKVLGEGGFGRVYQGLMPDGTEVAVKLLTKDRQNGDGEFNAEIETLGRLHHRNLVKLVGICIEQRTRCLVYELVSNGNVESHLHGNDKSKAPLDWYARLKIALGAARGLAYLHEDADPHVIHRDFKASNVLLEDDFTPKISDFGLAREAADGSHHVSTRVMGTFGYVAPEYAMTGHLVVRSDVYSYGVVLLELLSGREPIDMSQPPGQENLVTWARPLLTHRAGLEQLVDPMVMTGAHDFDDVAKVAAVAAMCVHQEVAHRPFMGEVVRALELLYDNNALSLEEEGSSARCSDLESDLATHSNGSLGNDTKPSPTNGPGFCCVTMDYSSTEVGRSSYRAR